MSNVPEFSPGYDLRWFRLALLAAIAVSATSTLSACAKKCRTGSTLSNGVCKSDMTLDSTVSTDVAGTSADPGAAVATQSGAQAAGPVGSASAGATGSATPSTPTASQPAASSSAGSGAAASGLGDPSSADPAAAGSGAAAATDPSNTASAPQMGECQPSETSCDGAMQLQCSSAGRWEPGIECPYVCVNGTCSGSCRPGEQQCSGNTTQACSEDGVWVDGEICPNVCSSGQCAGQCVPGAKQCSRLSVEICGDDGNWSSAESCPYVCEEGNCVGECEPNSVRCSSQTPETCDASGMWRPGQTCPYLCDNGRCTGTCRPGDDRCMGPVQELCSDAGQWTRQAITIGVCNVDCIPDESGCDGFEPTLCDASGHIRRLPVSPPACNAVCIPNASGCTPDHKSTRCSSDGGRIVVGQLSMTCGADCTTPGMEGACAGTGRVQSCGSDGLWKTVTAKTGDCVCDPGELGCGVASDLAVICKGAGSSNCARQVPRTNDASLLRCSDKGRWEITQRCGSCFLCPSGTPGRDTELGSACKSAGTSLVCVNNADCPIPAGANCVP
jgi:hypothetical protein